MDKAIILEHVTKKYKNGRGIEDISLTVEKGEIFGFLGPNGAGKTTAMKVMTGLITPDAGKVILGGYPLETAFEAAMQCVGSIVEKVSPFPALTAYENMRFCARFYKGVDDARIEECLQMTGILPFKNERVKNFSLGMEQRMGIAMAILSNPSILILDEPLNGLDVEGMVEMRHLFQRLSETQGTTIFISSHLIHDVELTCSRVGLVLNGKILATRSMEDVLRDFSTLENFYLSEVGEGA
ncbi:MAG: ABC transporter ATP-binding protein [Clostridia bacterium]|nr:ABC transporter ATP-binding protein [Clostridia bacterium]